MVADAALCHLCSLLTSSWFSLLCSFIWMPALMTSLQLMLNVKWFMIYVSHRNISCRKMEGGILIFNNFSLFHWHLPAQSWLAETVPLIQYKRPCTLEPLRMHQTTGMFTPWFTWSQVRNSILRNILSSLDNQSNATQLQFIFYNWWFKLTLPTAIRIKLFCLHQGFNLAVEHLLWITEWPSQ